MPGIYAVTSTPVVRRTRATLRRAELGFFGVWVNTRVQTPRRWGEPLSAGVLVFSVLDSRPLRTSWAIVGTRVPSRDFSGALPERKALVDNGAGAPGARRRCRSQQNRIPRPVPRHQPVRGLKVSIPECRYVNRGRKGR